MIITKKITDYNTEARRREHVATVEFTVAPGALTITAHDPADQSNTKTVTVPIHHRDGYTLKINKKSIGTADTPERLAAFLEDDFWRIYRDRLFYHFVGDVFDHIEA